MMVELFVPFHAGETAWRVLAKMAEEVRTTPTSYLWDDEKRRIIEAGIQFLMPYLVDRLQPVNP
jgi:hypothetical protein